MYMYICALVNVFMRKVSLYKALVHVMICRTASMCHHYINTVVLHVHVLYVNQ